MPEIDASAALGRWATLQEAARILDVRPDKLLRQLKRGKRRGTQIGNNWFAYIDPDVESVASGGKKAKSSSRPERAPEIDALKSDNSRLRDRLERLESDRAAPTQPAAPETVSSQAATPAPGQDLAPLIDRISEVHKSSTDEIEFLRGEIKAVREQHAAEMRRKDILLQQAHKSLQEAVRAKLPRPAPTRTGSSTELTRLRQDYAHTNKLLREMTSLMAVMYRRIRDV